MFSVPTLMYHHVDPDITSPISVTPLMLDQQLQALFQAGWTTLKVGEVLKFLMQGQEFPPKKFVITFDDGYLSVFQHALPVLKKYGMGACVYALSRFLGKKDRWNHRADFYSAHMNQEQLIELLNEGWEVGCHTGTHQSLVKLSRKELETETCGAKKELEDALNHDVNLFCYPYGTYNSRVRDFVSQYFSHAYTVEEGTNNWEQDKWAIKRIYVGMKQTADKMVKLVEQEYLVTPKATVPPKEMRRFIG